MPGRTLRGPDGAVLGRATVDEGTTPPRAVLTPTPGAPADRLATTVVAELGGHRISLRDAALAAAVEDLGVPVLRASWLLALALPPDPPLRPVTVPGVEVRTLPPDPGRHAPVTVAAYAAGHPDHDQYVATLEAATAELAGFHAGAAVGPVIAEASVEAVAGTGEVLGYCIITAVPADEEYEGGPWVTDLAVAPTAQGRGVGRLLLTEAVDRLSGAGHRGLGLAVTRANTGARRLYDTLGFVERFAAWTFLLP